MNRKEIAEIKKQFTPENCSITRICGCYVDGDKNKKTKLKEAFLSLPDEEMFKYFDIFKKTLSGRLGKNLMNLDFPLEQEKEGWDCYFAGPLILDNIHNSKTAKILTPDATICISPDQIKLVELQEVNGVPSLVIPVNGKLEVNGIEISLRGDDGHDEFSE